MWGYFYLCVFIIAVIVYFVFFREKEKINTHAEILQHLDDKIFTGGEDQKNYGAKQVKKLLNDKINIQEAKELYIQKISLLYFEKYDSRNDNMILHLSKSENSKIDFFDKIELYNFFTQEHLIHNNKNWVDGYAIHDIITNSRGKAVDYRFIDINADFERLTGYKRENIVGLTIKQVSPKIEEFWISTYGDVALNNKLAKFEYFDKSLNKLFAVTAYSPKPKRFISFIKEIKNTNKTSISA